jgi:organic radical activating enzyme
MKINKFELIQTNLYPEFDLKITLKPSYRCNQNCWFCEEYNNSSVDWSLDDCNNVLNKLKEIPKNKKKIFIYFYGGEPTLSQYWEYIQYKLVDIFSDKELFIQTQTNLSIDKERLEKFLIEINKLKQDHHKIDICSSYHLGKQTVEIFKEKMDSCHDHNALGLCFINTDFINEDKFINEFNYLKSFYNDKMKIRFTEIGEGTRHKKEAKKYPELSNSNDIKSFEYNYFINKYKWVSDFLEEGFNFQVDNDVINFSEVSARNIHKKFRLMKCECGTKNIVIDHNLKVYHCNDDFNNGINILELVDVDFRNYLEKNNYCMNKSCFDGLEFTKWR